MTKQELISELVELQSGKDEDIEMTHARADELLLGFINDPDVIRAYREIPKWL